MSMATTPPIPNRIAKNTKNVGLGPLAPSPRLLCDATMADFRAGAQIQIPQIPTPSVKSVKSVIFHLQIFLPVVAGAPIRA